LVFNHWRLSNSNRKGKQNLNEKRKVALIARQTVAVKSCTLRGAGVGLFIGEVKSLIIMP
jgi:hypothetical protein